MRPFTENEIKEALFRPTKAPGPDGFSAAFFQKHWNSVGEGVLATCLHILNEKAKTSSERNSSWQNPPQRFFKVNVDAAINRDKHQGVLGVVIRDQEGNVAAAAIKQIIFNGDVALVEAAAVKLGIQVAIDAGLTPLTIETDCKDVVDFF